MDNAFLFSVLLAQGVLGFVFLLASFVKWYDLPRFQRLLKEDNIFSHDHIPILAHVVAGLETFVGFALLLNWYPKATASIALGLLLVFTGITIVRFRLGDKKGCGCFGADRKSNAKTDLIRNALLLVLSLSLLFYSPISWSLPLSVSLLLYCCCLHYGGRVSAAKTSSSPSFEPHGST